MRNNRLGQAPPATPGTAAVQILTSVANLGLQFFNAKAIQQMQVSFQRKLDTDAAKMAYIKDMVARVVDESSRLAQSRRAQPTTLDFDKLLAQLVKNDMIYHGSCNVDILNPVDTKQASRTVWATISRNGAIAQPNNLPPEVGFIWASGCKAAEDQSRIDYIESVKSGLRFNVEKTLKLDLSTSDIIVRVVAGLLLVVGFILVIKVQRKVIQEEKDIRIIRKKKQKPSP